MSPVDSGHSPGGFRTQQGGTTRKARCWMGLFPPSGKKSPGALTFTAADRTRTALAWSEASTAVIPASEGM